MEKLNHECLEHIFGYLNCGPKEWLALSEVCLKWRDVITRFWRRIDQVEIGDSYLEYNSQRQFLSTRRVIAILEFASQHVREIDITKRDKINNIKLANRRYNLNGLNRDAVVESFMKNSSSQILKANVLADDQKFLDYLIDSNGMNLKELELTLDETCFEIIEPREYNLRSKVKKVTKENKEEVVDEVNEESKEEVKVTSATERLDHKNFCAKLSGQILESFPKLERLTVTLTSVNQKQLDIVDELLSLLSKRESCKARLEEVYVHICGKGISDVLSILCRHCFEEMLQPEAVIRSLRLIDTSWNLDVTLSLPKASPESRTRKIFKIISVTISNSFTRCYQRNRNEMYLDTFCKLLNRIIPSLQELNLSAAVKQQAVRLSGHRQPSDMALIKQLLLYAIKLAMPHRRKVVINKSIEVIRNDTDGDQVVNVQTLFITITLNEQLEKFLEHQLPGCKVTVKS